MHAFCSHDLISSFLTASLEDWVSYYRLFFTDGKTKAHRGGAGCLSPIAQHWHSDSRVHACDCCVLLALHVTVVCQTPRASMVNKKTWSLTLKSFQFGSTSSGPVHTVPVPALLSLEYLFPLSPCLNGFSLSWNLRSGIIFSSPFWLPTQGASRKCLTYAYKQRQHCLVVTSLRLRHGLS